MPLAVPLSVMPKAWDLEGECGMLNVECGMLNDMKTRDYGKVPNGGVTSFYDFSQDDDVNGQPGAGAVNDDDKPAVGQGDVSGSTSPLATPTFTGNGGTSSSSSTTTTISPYAQFKGNNYKELEDFLLGQMGAVQPETKEERERRERREKRIGFLARLADGLGTFHTAFSHARGLKAMDMPNMSAKARERFEKAKAERDKDNDRLVNYAVTLGKIRDADRDFNFRVTQAEQQQSQWQQQFDAGRQDRADDVAFRDKKFDSDNEHWQKGFDENQRQFDVTAKEHERHNRASEGLQGASIAEQRRHNKASEGLEAQRIAASQDGRYTEFLLDDGGIIKVPNTRLNIQNISWIAKQAGIPTTKEVYKSGSFVPTQEHRTADELLMDIGQNLSNGNVRTALLHLGGQRAKGTGYGGNNGKGKGY